MTKKSSREFIDTMQEWFDKAPALPKNVRQALVNITPWIALIFGILGILGGIAGLGLLTVFAPFAMFGGASGITGYGTGFLAEIIWLVASILLLAAFPGTKARKLGGWTLLFWSEVLHLVGSLVAFSFISGIIGAVIAFYLLFQIKPYYK